MHCSETERYDTERIITLFLIYFLYKYYIIEHCEYNQGKLQCVSIRVHVHINLNHIPCSHLNIVYGTVCFKHQNV